MEKIQVINECANDVVTNEQLFAQAVKDGKEKSVKKSRLNVGDENTAYVFEESKTVQRSWLIYAEREFASEIKAVANEHFARLLLGEETIEKARFAVLKLAGRKLMQDGASKGRLMFKATLRKVCERMKNGDVEFGLPTAELISETRRSMKEEAKAIKLAAERKAKAAKIAEFAEMYSIPVEVAERMFADGVKIV